MAFYVLFSIILTPATEGLSSFLPMHLAFTSTISSGWEAQQHVIVNSQSPLQLPNASATETRGRESGLGFRSRWSLCGWHPRSQKRRMNGSLSVL